MSVNRRVTRSLSQRRQQPADQPGASAVRGPSGVGSARGPHRAPSRERGNARAGGEGKSGVAAGPASRPPSGAENKAGGAVLSRRPSREPPTNVSRLVVATGVSAPASAHRGEHPLARPPSGQKKNGLVRLPDEPACAVENPSPQLKVQRSSSAPVSRIPLASPVRQSKALPHPAAMMRLPSQEQKRVHHVERSNQPGSKSPCPRRACLQRLPDAAAPGVSPTAAANSSNDAEIADQTPNDVVNDGVVASKPGPLASMPPAGPAGDEKSSVLDVSVVDSVASHREKPSVLDVSVVDSSVVDNDRPTSAPAKVDPRLAATAAMLNFRAKKDWFKAHDQSGKQEWFSLLNESDVTPRLRGALATAAGLPQDSAQETDACLQPTPESPSMAESDSPPVVQPTFRQRLWQAIPAADVKSRIDWSRLVAVETVEALNVQEDPSPEHGRSGKKRKPPPVAIDVNTGGSVFFGILAPREGQHEEEAVALKFCNSRHMLQSEQMAAELAWHLEIDAPSSRILLKVHDDDEWQELASAVGTYSDELAGLLKKKQSMLLMQFVHGCNLQKEKDAWSRPRLNDSAHALGRLFVLDLLLGNADRLPIKSLVWRGNPGNVLWSNEQSEAHVTGHCVPIDAIVARRPPKFLVQEVDQKAGCLLELSLLDRKSAQGLLMEAVSCNGAAVAAFEEDWVPSEPAWQEKEKKRREAESAQIGADADDDAADGREVVRPHSALKAFHEGIRSALSQALRDLGLLEMVADVLGSWLEAFRADMSDVVSGKQQRNLSATRQLKDWAGANESDEVKDRASSWQTLLEEKSLALRSAADDWAHRRGVETTLSFRGFLGDSVINPITDAYELLVRLRHLLARGKVMADASFVTRPVDLSPSPLLVGPVTASCCFHLLRKLGVTTIINCTKDLPEPDAAALGQDIAWYRLALEDIEDQDLSESLEEGLRIIDSAAAKGGRVMVHCHEGKSRSVSLCLSYFMTREKRPLADAMKFMKTRRPQIRVNAGFLRQLLDLELSTLGSNSMNPNDLPKGKPKLQSVDKPQTEE